MTSSNSGTGEMELNLNFWHSVYVGGAREESKDRVSYMNKRS